MILALTWSVVAKFGGEENVLLAPPATGGRLHHACFNPDTMNEKKFHIKFTIICTGQPASPCSSLPAGT